MLFIARSTFPHICGQRRVLLHLCVDTDTGACAPDVFFPRSCCMLGDSFSYTESVVILTELAMLFAWVGKPPGFEGAPPNYMGIGHRSDGSST